MLMLLASFVFLVSRNFLPPLLCFNHSYLNGFGPLQIGGVQNVLDNPAINYGGFEGCIRKVFDNSKMYDLLNPLLEKNTELGCKLANNPCPDCSNNGYCEPLWTNSICVCDLGFTGPNCNSSKRLKFLIRRSAVL